MPIPEATYDEVNTAFLSGTVLADPDERLLAYLRVLCTAQIRSDENRLLANNRTLTLNAILTKRYLQRQDRKSTVLTGIVIVLAVLNVIGIVVQASQH